jgi:hypothetical protein
VTTHPATEILAADDRDSATHAACSDAVVTAAILVLPLGAAIALPHVVRLDRAPSGVGAAIWLNALALRALSGPQRVFYSA